MSVSWAVGTVVLVVVALVAPDAIVGAAVGQLAAAVLVLGIQGVALRHGDRR